MMDKTNTIYAKFLKRVFDFLLAFLALVILFPLLVVLAVIVRLKIGSPIIFKQQRPGLNEKIFTLYKFEKTKKTWDEIIFIDDNPKVHEYEGFPVYTLDTCLQQYPTEQLEFIVSAGEPFIRKKLYEKLAAYSLKITKIIYPHFFLFDNTNIGNGSIIQLGAAITCNTQIGFGCLINIHAVISHDVTISDYSVISPNAAIGGDVRIGEATYIGSGAVIRNGITIGKGSIIGMGSVVLQDVKDYSVVIGNPAKFLRVNENKKVFVPKHEQ